MSTSSIASDTTQQKSDTATKINSPLGRRISQIIFWMVFFAAIILSVQAILPSIAFFRESAAAAYGDTLQARVSVWGIFIARSLIRLIFLGVGTLIYFQKPDDRMSVITSIFLLACGAGGTLYVQYVPEMWAYTQANLLYLHYPLSYLVWLILFFYFIIFPDDRTVPKIALLQIVPVLILNATFYLPQDDPFYPFNWHPIFLVVILVTAFGIPLAAQVYRYRTV